MALRKHECIELLSQVASKVGFANLVKKFEVMSPLDKNACQQQYWQKVPVGNLRAFVDSLQEQKRPTLMSPDTLTEKELPDSVEDIEIDIEFEDIDDLDSLNPTTKENNDSIEWWDEDENEESDEEEDEEEDDLFDFNEEVIPDDEFTL